MAQENPLWGTERIRGELFKLGLVVSSRLEDQAATAIDPVCGMSIDKATAEYRSFRDGGTYYFCSAGCTESFDKDPERYVKASGTHRY